MLNVFSGIKNQFFYCKLGVVTLCIFLLIISQYLPLLILLDVIITEDFFYVPLLYLIKKSTILLLCFLMAELDASIVGKCKYSLYAIQHETLLMLDQFQKKKL